MSIPARKPKPRPRLFPDGTLRCFLCDEPNDPPGSNAARCTKHKKAKKAEVEKQSKERGKQGRSLLRRLSEPTTHSFPDSAYTGPLGVAVLPSKASEIRDLYGRLLTVVEAARRPVHEEDDEQDRSRRQEAVLAAVHDLNGVLGPVLYGTAARGG